MKTVGRILMIIIGILCCLRPGLGEGTISAEELQPVDLLPARGYILVTTTDQELILPLPEEEDYLFPLSWVTEDCTVKENVLHVTPEGVYMESSTCENQDCVHQGTVTLENRKERVLYNMIICLPHQVTLQLFTPEEMLSQL